MNLEFPNITLGTAGHIDHGKTSLVRFLTGCDTDTLKEEKARGMTIDLGHAPCTIGNLQVGIVDVPGHEAFIKTMVAGASGMDGVILVVAADDGVMPQTREHLEILTLLGIRHGVVALTKADRVDPELLPVVADDVRAFLQGTFLAEAPIFPVDNLTGAGFLEFLDGLAGLVKRIEPKRTDGVFRMPVERSFSAVGAGTVVAGIPVSGRLTVGDELMLYPEGLSGRVRSIQVYGRTAPEALSGQCAAINVTSWEAQEIRRGQVIATPGCFVPGEWYFASLRLLQHERLQMKNGQRIKLHTGTTEVQASVYLTGAPGPGLTAGADAIVQIHADNPLTVAPGDRFIIRSMTPVRSIGGGTFLEMLPERVRRVDVPVAQLEKRCQALAAPETWLDYCLETAPEMLVDSHKLARAASLPPLLVRTLAARLLAGGRAVRVSDDVWCHAVSLQEAGARIQAALAAHHQAEPASPGVDAATLQKTTGIPRPALNFALGKLQAGNQVKEANSQWSLASHRPQVKDQEQALLEAVEAGFKDKLYAPPSRDELAAALNQPPARIDRAMQLLKQHGRIIFVGEGIHFHREAVETAQKRLEAHIVEKGKLESVDFKYLVDTTRKYALPLLDYFDRTGFLTRSGNTRYLRYRKDK
jgi:selenocysteine-specific elongation factor